MTVISVDDKRKIDVLECQALVQSFRSGKETKEKQSEVAEAVSRRNVSEGFSEETAEMSLRCELDLSALLIDNY